MGKWSSSWQRHVRSEGSCGAAGVSFLSLRSRRLVPLPEVHALSRLARLTVLAGLVPSSSSSGSASSSAPPPLMGASWRNSAYVMSAMRLLTGFASSPYTT